MIRPSWLAALLLATAAFAQAQTAPAPAASPAPAPASGKKELVQKIVALQQPSIEALARQMVEVPAAQMLQGAGQALQQRVPADKREAVAAEIQADARRYVEDALPLVRDRAVKIAPEVLGPVLEQKLSDDELRQVLQVLQMMESPALRKYGSLQPELIRAMSDRLGTDLRGSIDPKLKALQDSLTRRLGISPRPASGPASGAATTKKP